MHLEFFLLASLSILFIGIMGLFFRRNILSVVLSIQTAIFGINLAFLVLAILRQDKQGQIFALMMGLLNVILLTAGFAFCLRRLKDVGSLDTWFKNSLKN